MADVTETLKKAHEAVIAAEIPTELHEVAFREAVRLLVPNQPMITTARPSVVPVQGKGADAKTKSEDVSVVPEDVMHEQVSRETGADRAKVEQLFHLDNNVPVVSLPGLRLGKNNAEKTRVIAQVLTIARGFGMGEVDTSVEVIRNEATRLKCYDSANFMSHLSTLDGYVITGSGSKRRIRAKATGVQGFPALVDRLVGEA